MESTVFPPSVYGPEHLEVAKAGDLHNLTNFDVLRGRDHIARGEATKELVAELAEKIDRLKTGDTVDAANLENYSTAIKILMIHYALDFKKVISKSLSHFAIPHECSRIKALLKRFSGDFDLAVHGHLHTPKVYYCGSLPVIAVGTSAQRTLESARSVYLIKITESGKIFAEHHHWPRDGNGFSRDPNDALTCEVAPAKAA